MESSDKSQSWEMLYQQNDAIWGEQPDHLLLDYAGHKRIPLGPVLDLGMGEGRNALFFARLGYPVRGVDLSPTAVERCQARARALNVSIQTEVNNILAVEIEPDSLTLVICTMCLQFVKKSEGQQILHRIHQGLKSGGMVYLTMFSTDEPRYADLKHSGEEVEPNTYYLPHRDTYLHFYTQAEVLAAFPDFQLHYIAPSIMLDPGHPGAEEPHYHGIITYLGQKP